MKMKISVSIVNVTSYTGIELLRLLSQHPLFSVEAVTARSAAGHAELRLQHAARDLQGCAGEAGARLFSRLLSRRNLSRLISLLFAYRMPRLQRRSYNYWSGVQRS